VDSEASKNLALGSSGGVGWGGVEGGHSGVFVNTMVAVGQLHVEFWSLSSWLPGGPSRLGSGFA
jgi:hypothetical protein